MHGSVPAYNDSLHIEHSIQDGTCALHARKKPPHAANVHVEGSRSCNDTSGKSARLSLRANDTSSSSELEHAKTTSGALERSARDRARMDLELLLNLVRSETRPTSEASSRHPSGTANAKPFLARVRTDAGSNHCGGDMELFRTLSVPCAQLTMVPLQRNRTPARF